MNTSTAGLRKVGAGAFSTVYRKDRRTVLIESRDKVKECMSKGWFPNTALFPKLKRVSVLDDYISLYEEKYYPPVNNLKNSLNSYEWEFYKELCTIFSKPLRRGAYLTRYSAWREAFESISGRYWRRKRHLQEALDAISNYGEDICFEISARNVAVHKGKLVLLDCFFLHHQL